MSNILGALQYIRGNAAKKRQAASEDNKKSNLPFEVDCLENTEGEASEQEKEHKKEADCAMAVEPRNGLIGWNRGLNIHGVAPIDYLIAPARMPTLDIDSV